MDLILERKEYKEI